MTLTHTSGSCRAKQVDTFHQEYLMKTPTPFRSNDIYAQLKTLILAGQLQSGERLVERELARRFKISRIPLRESLIRLEGEGLVRSVANTATYVEDFSPQDTVEIYTLRLVLEPLGTRLAALRTTADLVRTLRAICKRMTQLSEKRDWRRLDHADYEFHHTIVDASQHRRLIRAYDLCQIQILGREGVTEKLSNLAPDFTARQHARILECIEQGDARGAEAVSRDHVDEAMKKFLSHHGFVVQGAANRDEAAEPENSPASARRKRSSASI
jgi:DNA-binding GntR family transcriptional regulator